jgi:hypothetical protein
VTRLKNVWSSAIGKHDPTQALRVAADPATIGLLVSVGEINFNGRLPARKDEMAVRKRKGRGRCVMVEVRSRQNYRC